MGGSALVFIIKICAVFCINQRTGKDTGSRNQAQKIVAQIIDL